MRLQFGPWTLDEESRQLLREGRPVHLPRKNFELLAFLLERRPDAVSKAEIHARLWPSSFVSDATLSSLVSDLRVVLEDPAKESRYLRTVHGFGYAFYGSAEDISSPAPAFSGCRLIWEDREVALLAGENVLGRTPEALVWLDSAGVSRRHARIVVEGTRATLEDLGSKNGTFLGTKRLEGPTPLEDGDEIRVGRVRLIFRAVQPEESTVTQGSSRGG